MVDIEAKKAEGKGIGYQQWASVFNLKQIANSVNVYTEYGFSSPEELDAPPCPPPLPLCVTAPPA